MTRGEKKESILRNSIAEDRSQSHSQSASKIQKKQSLQIRTSSLEEKTFPQNKKSSMVAENKHKVLFTSEIQEEEQEP